MKTKASVFLGLSTTLLSNNISAAEVKYNFSGIIDQISSLAPAMPGVVQGAKIEGTLKANSANFVYSGYDSNGGVYYDDPTATLNWTASSPAGTNTYTQKGISLYTLGISGTRYIGFVSRTNSFELMQAVEWQGNEKQSSAEALNWFSYNNGALMDSKWLTVGNHNLIWTGKATSSNIKAEPVLSIKMGQSNKVKITWPVFTGTYNLQANANLGTNGWQIISSSLSSDYNQSLGECSVTLPANGLSRYFKLTGF